ncbi:hypothetical protein Tsubulata_038273 [Turnera subulata]|uniref:2Fe-2S ferredoxin-type domain-containing protein n=1 Tax=Turnera subulata TaxID=218843 RepID=A0A9Q0FHT5_9ROSI|nr:hypothetical protein Tsubulata_038273 [Turnera subulata]
MGSLQLSSYYGLASLKVPNNFYHSISTKTLKPSRHISFSRGKIRAISTVPDSEPQAQEPEEEPSSVYVAFVHYKPLSNCGGGGTCATCMVEVVQGKELLNPRTDKEKEKLKRKPRNFRLACQTTVSNPESGGMVVIQQLPEWKAHEWGYEKLVNSEVFSDL